LGAGDVIRVRTSQSAELGFPWIEGRVVRLTPDTLWYLASGGVSPVSFAGAEIQRGTGRKNWRNGIGIGALAGAAVGALVADRSFEPRFGYEDGAVGGALIGGAAGFFVGKMMGGWETVDLDQLMIGDGNLAVSLSIRR
jgi:hypothetical protein